MLKRNFVAGYLFGSYATNSYETDSDVDILIIVRASSLQTRQQLSELSSAYSLKYDVCISPVIKDRQTWEKNEKHQTLFYQEITRVGIPI